MSRETDSIIAVHKASGAPGVVTDINTPGVHTRTGNHYKRDVTPAVPTHPMDVQRGTVGRAVDFGNRPNRLTDEEALEVFNVFAPYGERGHLAELFCGQAEWCVYNGRWQRWTSVPKRARDKIRNSHMDHLHVAVKAGRFLTPMSKPSNEDKKELVNMAEYASEYRWLNGDAVQVLPDGSIRCAGAKFYGSMHDLRDERKQGFKTAFIVRPVNNTDSQAGYIVTANSGDYAFKPGVEQFFKS